MKAPRLPSFFKTLKNKSFKLYTRYYDERKERIQNVINKVEKNQINDLEKGHFSNSWKKNSTKADHSSLTRIVIIIFLLGIISYLILK